MFTATLIKELKLLLRDKHALAVLFLMPLAFVIIMSLALPNSSQTQSKAALSGLIFSPTDSTYNLRLSDYFQNISKLSIKSLSADSNDEAIALFADQDADFLLILPKQEEQKALDKTETLILLKPYINQQQAQVLQGFAQQQLGKARLFSFMLNMSGDQSEAALKRTQEQVETTIASDTISIQYPLSKNQAQPNAVQQSVPAWLVFGMFFILIPLSSTLIIEKQQGTLQRLRSMRVSTTAYLAGKFIPFFIINQIQLAIMVGSGFFLIPLLGGEQLTIAGNPLLLGAVAFATSFAAIGFGLFIASFAKTIEQATAIGGASNIILAAIGGIMIPKFVMPEAMQAISNISPMSWALDGFLAVILNSESSVSIATYIAALCTFAIICFAATIYYFNKGNVST